MLAVPGHAQASIELISNLGPLLGAVLTDQLDKLLVLPLDPVALLNCGLFVLVKLVLTLRIVATRDEAGNLYPIVLVKFLRLNALAFTILLDCPSK